MKLSHFLNQTTLNCYLDNMPTKMNKDSTKTKSPSLGTSQVIGGWGKGVGGVLRAREYYIGEVSKRSIKRGPSLCDVAKEDVISTGWIVSF